MRSRRSCSVGLGNSAADNHVEFYLFEITSCVICSAKQIRRFVPADTILVRYKTFKDVALADARHAFQTREISALLVVIPLSEKYLGLVRGMFQQSPKLSPTLISIDSAGAIAEADRAYESFDVPKGTLRGNPPVPDDDLTTLRTSLYLVANKNLSTDLVATLTQTIMKVRRELLAEQPILRRLRLPARTLTRFFLCTRERRLSTTEHNRASWMSTATGSI